MITFQRAPVVEPGQPLTSRQINSQARAFTDRILSGVGNCAERIVDYAWGLGRQVRNPDTAENIGIGNWPYADEWLRIYAYADPRNGGLPWPEAAPGEPQGLSLSNPFGAFVFGNAASNLDPEEDRVSDNGGSSPGIPLWLNFGDGLRAPQTAAEGWELGKHQRGGIDPATGLMSARAVTAAQSHYRIQYPSWSRFLAAYGGMLPSRSECSIDGGRVDCGDILYYDENDTPHATPRYEVIFTPTEYGASLGRQVRRFDGFCPPDAPNSGADCNGTSEASLAGIGYGEWWYTLYVYEPDGNGGFTTAILDQLSTAEYIEGPYSGGGVMARDVSGGRHLNVSLNWFLHDFRGSLQELAQPGYNPAATAFSFGKFFSRQYLLAPAKGTVQGNEIVVAYPRFEWTGGCPSGTSGTLQGGGSQHTISAGFVCAGVCASATGLANPVTIRVTNATTGDTLTELALVPVEGKASASWWPEVAPRCVLAMTVQGSPQISPGGALWAEVAELWEWKPTIPDAYLVLRMSSTKGGNDASLDSDGLDVASPVAAWDNYSRFGCVVNPGASGSATVSYVTENPIYEAARRMIVSNVRLAAKPQLLNYAVQDGKSVFWFKRFAVLSNHSFDVFAGIAPSRLPIANGRIQKGVEYRLQGGEIRYAGNVIDDGSHFVGTDAPSWETTENSTGSEAVYEVTAIRLEAPPRGVSNRWVMFGSFNAYRNSQASLWKEELYDNSILYHNRCHTLSPQLRDARALNIHFTFGQDLSLISEGLPAYTYAEGVNSGFGFGQQLSPEARADQYRSCPVYPEPYEVESAVDEANDVVKVTLRGRLRHCAGSPASITPTPGDWPWLASGPAVQYRTDENAICEYLRYMAGGADCKNTSEPYADNPDEVTGDPSGFPWQVGDMANPNEQYKFGSDRPKGACLPRLYFVRLPEEVWEDDNDIPDADDVRPWMDTMAQREMYLRAMAGGWIDERATTTLSCESGHLFDYSFENLCFEAFGGRAIPVIRAADGNPWGGHGPLPATSFFVDPFNAISAAVNRLRFARVMIPVEVRSRVRTTAGKVVLAPNYRITPMGPGCSAGPETVDTALNGAFWNSVSGVPSTGWYDSCSAPGSCEYADGWDGARGARHVSPLAEPGAGIRVGCSNGAYEYIVWSTCDSGSIIVNPEHPALLALSPAQRSQFAEAPGVLGWMSTTTEWLVLDGVNGSNETQCGSEEGAHLPDAWGVKWRVEQADDTQCVLFAGGPITPPALPATCLWYHHPEADVPCTGGATTQVSFTPINNRDLFLVIPVEDNYGN